MNPTVKKLLPHLIAYFVLLFVAFIRLAPVVFEGKALQQSDNIQAYGMQAEIRKVNDQTGSYPLWTNSMFAGMPAFQILYPQTSLTRYVSKIFLLGNDMAPPHTGLLLLMAGLYLLLVVMGVDWRLSIVGAIGFGLAANHMSQLNAGHSTKIIASAYMAPILAGILLTFRGKYWLGGGLTALFTSLQLFANHIQITYYFFLTLLIFGVVYLVDALRNGKVPDFLKAAGVSAVAAAIGLATNTGRLLSTQEYAQETIRGKSELTQKAQGASGSKAGESGLSKDYAFSWSYGILETYNLLIPNFMGGSSNESFADASRYPNSETLKVLRTMNNQEQANSLAARANPYWGDQPFIDGALYMGAVFLLLFFLGAFLVKNKIRWYIITSVIFTIMVAWGKNFPLLNFTLFDYFPLFNKFRDVKMVLGVTNLLIVLLGILGLQAFFDKNLDAKQRQSALYKAGTITGSLVILGLLMSFGLDYKKADEDFPAAVAAAIAQDRAGLLRADAIRSLLFVALSFGILWFWAKNRFHGAWAVLGIGLLATIDVWGIGLRFINSDSFVSTSQKASFTAPTPADEEIMKDPDLHYRVADFRRNPFSNAITSYHHKSMGGYHAAKLMRYQELIERYLNDPGTNRHIYGMLNAKYFIQQPDRVFANSDALGNAWFVKSFDVVETPDAEMDALASLLPKEKAIISKPYAAPLEGFSLQFDSAATIKLTRYHPDTLTYSYSAASEQLAVFSEVYYPPAKGWSMYVDGQKAPDFTKANFILRAARLPAGQHEVKMVFSPKSYHSGEMISLIASLIVLALAGWGIWWFVKNYQIPEPANLPEGEVQTKQPTRRVKTEAKKKKK